MQYNFEWDPAKARQNLRKHKVSFEQAAQIFLDPFAVSIYDEEHSDEMEEERWVTLRMDRNNVLLAVVHTFQEIDPENCNVRLISARKATKREAEQYHKR